MDYGALIRQAWAIATRHRFLWALGLFVSGGFGGCSSTLNYRLSGQELAGLDPGLDAQLASLRVWLNRNDSFVLGLIGLAVLLALALMIVSCVATAGMAQASTRLARGEPTALGDTWRAGRRLFLRYYGLAFLVIAIIAAAIAAISLLFAFAVAAANSGGVVGVLLAIVLGLAGIAAALAVVPGAIGLSIASQLAQLAMAVEDLGPLAGLKLAVTLLRRETMTAFVLWLMSVALQLGATVVLAVVFAILVALLGGLGAAIYFATDGLGLTTIVYTVASALAVFGTLWGASAFFGSFLWSYWALAYFRLTEGPQAAEA